MSVSIQLCQHTADTSERKYFKYFAYWNLFYHIPPTIRFHTALLINILLKEWVLSDLLIILTASVINWVAKSCLSILDSSCISLYLGATWRKGQQQRSCQAQGSHGMGSAWCSARHPQLVVAQVQNLQLTIKSLLPNVCLPNMLHTVYFQKIYSILRANIFAVCLK